MIRILQCVNNMHRAGLETLLMNYYRSMDRSKIQFDFLTHRPERSDYDDEIESLGGKIYHAPRLYPQNYSAYFAYMRQFFREHPEYRIVHSHIDSMSCLPLLAAKKAGVPVRIAHSHSTAIDLDFKYPLKQCFRYGLRTTANRFMACGQQAGEFLFGSKMFKVLPNAVDEEKFRFDPVCREAKRRELGISDAFVIGHAGRFTYAKNHEFLLRIFESVRKRDPSSVLLLAGTGEKEATIRDLAKALSVDDSVRFLGSRSDMDEVYQAMDVFVMPSRFEGIPVVGVEAQFSGIPCVFSDNVPKEVAFTDLCKFVDLQRGADHWAEIILSCKDYVRAGYEGPDTTFDIRYASHILEQYYLEQYHAVEADTGVMV